MLHQWLEHWDEFGFGYWMAESRSGADRGRPIGCAGVRRSEIDGHHVLNLAYRFTPESGGSRLGLEAAREAVAFASEWVPDRRVTAVMRPNNQVSVRTAVAAGLSLIGETRLADDPPEWEPSLLYQAPVVDHGVGSGIRDELIDLWVRVNASGGAVGFMGATSSADVADRLDPLLDLVSAGTAALGALRQAQGTGLAQGTGKGDLLGFAFWKFGDYPCSHVGWLQRLMTEPTARGRNLGRILVGGLHALAREHGIEISRLSYRGGTGLETFYSKCGYREVGRVPGALRFGHDNRDDVEMAIRLDGQTL